MIYFQLIYKCFHYFYLKFHEFKPNFISKFHFILNFPSDQKSKIIFLIEVSWSRAVWAMLLFRPQYPTGLDGLSGLSEGISFRLNINCLRPCAQGLFFWIVVAGFLNKIVFCLNTENKVRKEKKSQNNNNNNQTETLCQTLFQFFATNED